jgi:predicted HicB family RNase H-like nuclease
MVKVLMLPEDMKAKITSKDVREALEKIGEEKAEAYETYHYTFNCPEEVFEKAKKVAKAKRVSLSYLVAQRLKSD